MRESIGGGWLLGIVALFIALFSGYLAVSLNYSKAFKVKNKIVEVLEDYGGFNENSEEIINNYLKEIYYSTVQVTENSCPEKQEFHDGGYCTREIIVSDHRNGKNRVYYKVTTFIKIELPLVNFNINLPLKGETKVIYVDN